MIALRLAGVIFLLVSLAHLLRLVFRVEVTVGAFTCPLWISAVGAAVLFVLALWMFKASRCRCK